jgi:uncharacterized membrane protein YjjP (DUF1212 family)
MHLKIACSVAVCRLDDRDTSSAAISGFEREIDFQIIAGKLKPKFGFEYVGCFKCEM